VTEFDGVPIRTTDEFLMRVRRALPYSTVKVVVFREGQKLEIPVKLGKQ
jgi:S1-C subfamily serine protease